METDIKFGQQSWNSSGACYFIRDLGGLRIQDVFHVNKGSVAGSVLSGGHLLHSKKAL